MNKCGSGCNCGCSCCCCSCVSDEIEDVECEDLEELDNVLEQEDE